MSVRHIDYFVRITVFSEGEAYWRFCFVFFYVWTVIKIVLRYVGAIIIFNFKILSSRVELVDQLENPDIADDKSDDTDDSYGSNKLLFPPPKRWKTAYLQ